MRSKISRCQWTTAGSGAAGRAGGTEWSGADGGAAGGSARSERASDDEPVIFHHEDTEGDLKCDCLLNVER
jgi:hypothetical protein